MPLPDFPPGQHVTAGDLNRLVDEANRRAIVTASPPLTVTSGPYGLTLSHDDGQFWAVVCDSTGSASAAPSASSGSGAAPAPRGWRYSEVQPDQGGSFRLVEGGRVGTAFEANGNPVWPGSIVRLYPGFGGDKVFVHCCGGPPANPVVCGGGSRSSRSPSATSSASGSSGSSSASGVPGTCQAVTFLTGPISAACNPDGTITVNAPSQTINVVVCP